MVTMYSKLADVFQSTFPRGERPKLDGKLTPEQIFQSTFPRGERRLGGMNNGNGQLFQSTFPRGERQHRRVLLSEHLNFNPRSRVGNDGLSQLDHWQGNHFNPRSRVGNDNTGSPEIAIARISIHVPAWGTTANFHKYSLLFYAINIIFLLFIIPFLFSLVLFILLF